MKIIRNYEYWQGHNEFYCKGKIMLGPNGCSKLIQITILINLPSVMFLLFTIWVNINHKKIHLELTF